MRAVEVTLKVWSTRRKTHTTEKRNGVFHGWGVWPDGEGATETVAIIEFEDGTADLVAVHQTRFLEPAKGDQNEK